MKLILKYSFPKDDFFYRTYLRCFLLDVCQDKLFENSLKLSGKSGASTIKRLFNQSLQGDKKAIKTRQLYLDHSLACSALKMPSR